MLDYIRQNLPKLITILTSILALLGGGVATHQAVQNSKAQTTIANLQQNAQSAK